MKFLPSEKIEIVTTLSKDEVKQILANYIGPKRTFNTLFDKRDESKIFHGEIEQDFFKIQRIINGKNSFNPQIKGEIKSYINGTRLIIDFKLNTFVKIFIIYWISFVSLAFVITIIGALKQYTIAFFIPFPLIMLIFAIVLTNYGFNSQKTKSIEDLSRILNGKVRKL